jgi:hypothetical protein
VANEHGGQECGDDKHAQDLIVHFGERMSADNGACMWFPPTLDGSRNYRYTLYGTCTLRNSSKHMLGTYSIGIDINTVNDFLRQTAATQNTVMFLVDTEGLIVATTHTTDAFYMKPEGSRADHRAGCASSLETSPSFPERVGCRYLTDKFPYDPLHAIAVDLDGRKMFHVPGQQSSSVEVDGEVYYVVSRRIPSTLAMYSMNLLLFMPESDILGDIVEGRNVAIGVTVGVFVIATFLATVLVRHLLAPVDDIARSMYRAAHLEHDDDDLTSVTEDDVVLATSVDPEGYNPLGPVNGSDTQIDSRPWQRSARCKARSTRWTPRSSRSRGTCRGTW